MSARVRLVFLPSIVLAAAACSGGDGAAPRVTMDHGLNVGDVMTPVEVACGASPSRRVGESGRVQVVTFATPYDCSLCSEHLAGLVGAPLALAPGAESFAVLWAPSQAELRRQVDVLGERYPMCVDAKGLLWDAHALAHTPFTVVLRDGRVVYVNDQPLSDPAHRARFDADVASFNHRR